MSASRTPESHPFERAADKGFKGRLKNWWGAGRGYRDVWMLLITGLVVLALITIQSERADATRRNCNEVNQRHNAAVAETYRVVIDASAQFAKTPEEKARVEEIAKRANDAPAEQLLDLAVEVKQYLPAEAGTQIDVAIAQTIRVIDGLAPVRDCDEVVDRSVGGFLTF